MNEEERIEVFKHQVRDPAAALVYLTDCTLATVSYLAMKKSASKGELRRQISLAQTAIDWIVAFKVDFSGTRAQDVIDKHDGFVAAWAEHWKTPNV